MIVASYDLEPADYDAVIRHTSSLSGAARAEVGCHRFHFAWDVGHPRRLHLMECWADQAALDAHFQTAHFRDFMAWFAGVGKRNVRRDRFEVRDAQPFQPPR